MFSYYGSKSRIIKYYPKPLYDTIIEPFAGSAQYAFYYWERQVILIEKYKLVTDLWKYLQCANKKDIISLPEIRPKEDITKHKYLSQEEISLIYFCANRGSSIVYKIAGNFNNWSRNKKEIANNLHKIKHWKIIHGDYTLAPNIKATWFVDPPYDNRVGRRYKHNCTEINYDELGQWCKDRIGQTIVCEDLGALWLPFEYFIEGRGQLTGEPKREIFIEGIWTNINDTSKK